MTTEKAQQEAKKKPNRQSIILDWWREHAPDQRPEDETAEKETKRKTDRAVFARLRRCATPSEALLEPAAIDLAIRLGLRADADRRFDRAEAVGTVAAALAHVRTHDTEQSFAERLGEKVSGDQRLLSPLRFQRLIQAEPGPRQLDAMRRAIAQAKRRANVGQLGADLFDWSDLFRGDRIRTRWTFHYHGAGAAAPARAEVASLEETAA